MKVRARGLFVALLLVLVLRFHSADASSSLFSHQNHAAKQEEHSQPVEEARSPLADWKDASYESERLSLSTFPSQSVMKQEDVLRRLFVFNEKQDDQEEPAAEGTLLAATRKKSFMMINRKKKKQLEEGTQRRREKKKMVMLRKQNERKDKEEPLVKIDNITDGGQRGVFDIEENDKLSAAQKENITKKEMLHILNQIKLHQSNLKSNPQSSLPCDHKARANADYQDYFKAMSRIYSPSILPDTCVPQYQSCGWPRDSSKSNLPLLVIALGAEGSGHHTWINLLQGTLDCMMTETNQYKYNLQAVKRKPRKVSKPAPIGAKKGPKTRKEFIGYPHLTSEELGLFMRQYIHPNCRSIFDSLDSFPYGIIANRGRMMNHPDLVNLHQLDGVIFRLKYLILVRNATSGVMSTLGRRYIKNVDIAVRTTETALGYMDAALRGIPCHKTLVAYFEHIKARPGDILAPLAEFLELDANSTQMLRNNLFELASKSFKQTSYDFSYLGQCRGVTKAACRDKIWQHVDEFLSRRKHMWPTFSGRGDLMAQPQ